MQAKKNKKFCNKKISVIAISAVATMLSASAQIPTDIRNSEGLGYLERGRLMMQTGNYLGATDQLRLMLQSSTDLDIASKEECEYLLARATYERGNAECVGMLKTFLSNYPSSKYALDASLTLGDWYFFNKEFGRAALTYREIDRDKLEASKKSTYSYRLALSELKNGEFEKSRILFTNLNWDKDYNAASVFYLAYIDYVEGDYDKALAGFEKSQSLHLIAVRITDLQVWRLTIILIRYISNKANIRR
jgi:tetratricopeptide (TPR) repeat protein